MRIIAGERRGVRLHAPRGSSVRPTSDRVKEAIFNIVWDVSEARVLDAYAGTGALGLEALSRGAAAASLVERDRQTAMLARRNVEKVGLDGAEIVIGSIEAHLRREAARGSRYDLVLIDPPYGEAARAMKMLGKLLPPVLSDSATVVVETDRRVEPRLPLELVTSRTYGATRVSVFRGPG
ncbi:MAG: 16S rRNA (guanine(966)-N(2))-methyltransferase RsmD [Gaiellaceae bacterium]